MTRWGPFAALSAAVVLVIALALQNRRLAAAYTALADRASTAHPGYRVPWVPVRTLGGDSVMLGRPEPGTVQILFFYTTTCPHCRATVPAWNRIAEQNQGAVTLGLQLDSANRAGTYHASMQLQYRVVALDSALAVRIVDWYRVRRVPLTLVIGHDGRIAHSRAGRIEHPVAMDSVLEAVRRHVGVRR